MIVVTLTSWVKRIDNVLEVVKSVMNNTLQPDRLYLNLSKTEFEGIELSQNLIDYFNSDDRLIINWIEGENTKTMKKVFPILKYLNDEDIIINIDDDALLPQGFIKNRYDEFIKFNNPITSCNNPKYHYINKSHQVWSCGAGSIFKKKMLKGYDKFMDDKLIHSYNDDWCYSTLLWLNGYKFKPCTSYFMQNGSIDNNGTKLQKYNAIESMSRAHAYVDRQDMYNILNERIKNMFGVDFENAYGIFNKKLYDCVMPYGRVGFKSKIMTCGEHLEIEYVIASLKKYCSSWLRRIYIVGTKPPESIKKDVIHIPCDNPYTHSKDANIIHKLRYACEHISDLSDDFLMISDDQIVTKESKWEDMKPRVVRKYTDWSEEKWKTFRMKDTWQEYLYQTLKQFPQSTASVWQPHIWSPMNKYKFIEMCEKYDYKHSVACISQSLYYNFINEKYVKEFDHIHLLNNDTGVVKAKLLNINTVKRHLSWTDKPFEQKEFRDLLDQIVGFKPVVKKEEQKKKEPPKTNKTINAIRQLREDMQAGRLVKVPTIGGFVWKKIK